LEREYKANLLRRSKTAVALIFPIIFIIFIENIWIFTIALSLMCSFAIYEWITNNLKHLFFGILLIINFLISSIFFVNIEIASNISSYIIFLIIILNTSIYDSLAYLVGSRYGKIRITKRISPNKTLEGLLGGLFFSALYGYLIYKYLELSNLLMIIFVVSSFFAFIGDIYISYLKRKIGIKDTGSILPGHGGILDRLDSHLIATPVAIIFFILVI
jgi:phosphatidate cytidylyltransferase|tara:strand:+ start:1450 stop:2097 length:648 start_codon:yes stop_codon:yes gene_type:complete